MKRRAILTVAVGCVVAAAAARLADHAPISVVAEALTSVRQRVLAISASSPEALTAAQQEIACDLPPGQKSLRFAVIGDSGTGRAEQYQVAQEMEKCREKTGFNFVLMLGDNIYGGKSQEDFEQKFELPYKPLLDAGVKFYAAIGNHDNPNERVYKPFNMGGSRYYSFRKGNATFFVLDSNYMDSSQLGWLQTELQATNTEWKICYFHHPLYSDGRSHGPDLDLRAVLEPLFERYGVNVVLAGHEHVYERIRPKNGVYYFTLGNSGKLRYHNLRPSPDTLAGFDTDRDFMLVEIAGDKFYFQTISRTGQVVDSGALQRQTRPDNAGGS
jgi:predicted phosphodiesterase